MRAEVDFTLSIVICMLPSVWGLTAEQACATVVGNNSAIVKAVQNDVVPYLLPCGDVDLFISCWVGMRKSPDKNGRLEYHESDKVFPAEEDMRRAYYLFCVRASFMVKKEFSKDLKPRYCDHAEIKKTCDARIDSFAVQRMNKAFEDGDIRLAQYFACDAMIEQVLCKVKEYTDCYGSWEMIMDMELVKMGPSCLFRHNVDSLVTECGDAANRLMDVGNQALFISALLLLSVLVHTAAK